MEIDAVKMDDMNTIHAAFEDAQARVHAVFKSSAKTLVDNISAGNWESWDASSESPNVGKGILSEDDELDIDYREPSVA